MRQFYNVLTAFSATRFACDLLVWCPETGAQRERLVSALLPLVLDAVSENLADLVALALERYVGTLDSDKCLALGTHTHSLLTHTIYQCCGSLMFIPDPTFFHPGSELSPSRIRIKEFKYFNPKKWFLSSRKYIPGCSSRIRMLTFYPFRAPDPVVKKVPDPGSGSADLALRIYNLE